MPELLGVLGALNACAAELAAGKATDADLERMRDALDAIDQAASAEAIAQALGRFLDALGQASGNSLLAALCRFFAGLQINLANGLSGGSTEAWRNTTRRLAKHRRAVVDAIESHDAEAARLAARAYHQRSLAVIGKLPNPGSAQESDATMSSLLNSLLRDGA